MQNKSPIIEDVEGTLEQLIENQKALEVCSELEAFYLARIQESLMAHIVFMMQHLEKENQPTICSLKERVQSFTKENDLVSDKVLHSFFSIQPQIKSRSLKGRVSIPSV